MAYVTINYNEDGNQNNLGYKSVEVSIGMSQNKDKTETFSSGDFIKDWFNATKFILQNVEDSEPVGHSSSVDHFIMDGAKFDSAYLHVDKIKTGELLYFDRSKPNWWRDSYIDKQGIEMFVPRGEQWTWEQLKEYCK